MAEVAKNHPTYTTNFIKGDWDKTVYLDNPHVDNLMTAFLAMGAEFWALRNRVKIMEKFLDEKKIALSAAIESYVPTADEQIAWERERDEFIQRTFSVLTRETVTSARAPVPPLKNK